jgi:hypothetical protein
MTFAEQSHTESVGTTVGGSPEGGPPTDLLGGSAQMREVGT